MKNKQRFEMGGKRQITEEKAKSERKYHENMRDRKDKKSPDKRTDKTIS